jgi:hypothetical protein
VLDPFTHTGLTKAALVQRTFTPSAESRKLTKPYPLLFLVRLSLTTCGRLQHVS